MLEQGVVEPSSGPVFLSRPFLVPRKDRPEPRMVVDLSRLNKKIQCYRFRMLTLKQVRNSLCRDAWFTSLDLANAYWHVPIHRRFRPFLALQDGSRVLRFKVLPFGLGIAPRVFTKILKVVSSILLDEGVRVLMYLDDWLVQAASPDQALEDTQRTISVCEYLGFRFNFPKSLLVPTQRLTWLGMEWDSPSATLALSQDNRMKVLR